MARISAEGSPHKTHYDTYPPVPPAHQHHPHLPQHARTVPNSPAISSSGSLLHAGQQHAHHLGPRSYTGYSLGPPAYVDEQLVGTPELVSPHDGTSPHLGAPVQVVSPLVGAPQPQHQHSQPPSPGGGGGGYYTTFEPLPQVYPGQQHRLRQTSSDVIHGSPYQTQHAHHRPLTPEPLPQPRPVPILYGTSLKVVQWTPQHGDEGTQVTIVLDADAIRAARPSPYSNIAASFGPGSPALNVEGAPQPVINRRFAVIFGQAQAPTKFTRALAIDGNGVGQSMSAGPDMDDAFVVLTTFVPSRQAMGPPGERVMVLVQSIEVDTGTVVESCIVGEWDPQQATSAYAHRAPATPRVNQLKRSGDDLSSGREAPGLRSPAGSVHGSPVRGSGEWRHSSATHTPNVPQQAQMGELDSYDTSAAPASAPLPAPAPPAASTSSNRAPPPPLPPRVSASGSYPPQPELIRTSQIHAAKNGYGATYSYKVVLKLQGDLNTMAMGWSNEEWTARRRLVQFWPQQDGNIINVNFRPIPQSEYVQNSIVISCIFRDDFNECFVTSVDTIYLLEALVGSRFAVEEKNRIRRNLEGFKPQTVSKAKPDAEPFFKLIMGFPNPKPRNIEKDVKVFPWRILAQALKKIMSKYVR